MKKRGIKTFIVLMIAVCLSSIWGHASAAGQDIRLNPDGLRNVLNLRTEADGSSMSSKGVPVSPGELLIGIGEDGCTFGDVRKSMEKYISNDGDYVDFYGEDYGITIRLGEVGIELTSEEVYEVFERYTPYLSESDQTFPEEVMARIDEEVSAIRLYPSGTSRGELFMVYATDGLTGLIRHVEQVNGSLHAKHGWRQEGGTWLYYENGTAVSGPKAIDGSVYYFHPSMAGDKSTAAA